MADNEKFTQNRACDPITNETDKIIKNLEQSVSNSLNIYAQLNAGVTFYSSLQSKVTNLIQSAEDISYSQQLLRQEFENQLMVEFERTSQEQKDREYAQKVAEEFATVNITPPVTTAPYPSTSFSPTPYPSTNTYMPSNDLSAYPAVPGPPKPQKPPTLPSNVYAGAPITAPFTSGVVGTPPAYSPHVQTTYPNMPSGYYNGAPSSSSPQQQYSSNDAPSTNLDIHQKANRMSEMGFALHDCMNALIQHQGNEEAALNALLNQPTQQQQPQQQYQQQYQYQQPQQQYHHQQQYQQPQQQYQYQQPQQSSSAPAPAQQNQPSFFNFWKKPN